MKHPVVFAFDLDGVLVDTIGTLYSAYVTILSNLGAEGSPIEFEFLNGKNVQEIAEHLKHTHALSCTETELIELFQVQFDSLYSDVDLISGAYSILEFLRDQHARLALASSSSRKNIDVILKRFDLEPFFELIVSGDDVKQAKPSPDIYNLVKQHFGTNRCVVVEDSNNGIQAAQDAGLFTVHFNPGHGPRKFVTSYTIESLAEIKPIVLNQQIESILVSTCTDVELQTDVETHSVPNQIETLVDSIWQTEKARRPGLFNDPLWSYRSHSRTLEGKLLIGVTSSQYKYFLAQTRAAEIDLIRPLAVSGVAIDSSQRFLVGKRDRLVTEYPEMYEFVPSGGISSAPPANRPFQQQLAIELEEETGIALSSVEQIVPFGLTYDPRHGVYDIAVLVKLAIEIDLDSLASSEYSEFRLLDFPSLASFLETNHVVPASRVIHSVLPEVFEQLTGTQTSSTK